MNPTKPAPLTWSLILNARLTKNPKPAQQPFGQTPNQERDARRAKALKAFALYGVDTLNP